MKRLVGAAGLAVVAATLALAFGLGFAGRGAVAAEGEPVTFDLQPIAHFGIGRPDLTRFGRLNYVGGFEVGASTRAVGGLSGLVMAEDGRQLLAISDDGLMLQAAVERDGDGRPVGLSAGRLEPIRTDRGRILDSKSEADTEAIDVADDAGGVRAYISFEGTPRVMTGLVGADGFVGPLSIVRLPPSVRELRWTKGLEALAVSPVDGPLEGAVVVIAEAAGRRAETADMPGWVLGEDGFRFTVRAQGEFNVTDARFGPDGDLYVLERSFSLAGGVRTQIRQIDGDSLEAGAVLDGTVIFAADLGEQIDNMEGMDFWTDAAGRTRLSLISDDNRSFLQRTLYLEFVLEP